MYKIILVSLLTICPHLALANYFCTGKVYHLGADQELSVSNGFGVHKICNLSEDKCKFWASLLTTAKISDRSVLIYYSHPTVSGDQNNGACKTIGDWVRPTDVPYYVQLN
ncbi:hypothetical protein [Vibrio nigripulchritudo]|uniref:hypothetical protein n=1 Tax=Vibrio nigripulchritudo TaxID=28173 RepID=UPI000571939E|nr:hypothetical protein [Vibrio nigripulchritudo]